MCLTKTKLLHTHKYIDIHNPHTHTHSFAKLFSNHSYSHRSYTLLCQNNRPLLLNRVKDLNFLLASIHCRCHRDCPKTVSTRKWCGLCSEWHTAWATIQDIFSAELPRKHLEINLEQANTLGQPTLCQTTNWKEWMTVGCIQTLNDSATLFGVQCVGWLCDLKTLNLSKINTLGILFPLPSFRFWSPAWVNVEYSV